MEENVRFVWEKELGVKLYVAEKDNTYRGMKIRLQKIQEAIEALEEIRDLAEKANEYGVLNTSVYYYGGDFELEFRDAYLYIYPDRKEYEATKQKVKEEGVLKFLDELIEQEKQEELKMKRLLKEAEKYLIVEVELSDEEQEEVEEEDEEDC